MVLKSPWASTVHWNSRCVASAGWKKVVGMVQLGLSSSVWKKVAWHGPVTCHWFLIFTFSNLLATLNLLPKPQSLFHFHFLGTLRDKEFNSVFFPVFLNCQRIASTYIGTHNVIGWLSLVGLVTLKYVWIIVIFPSLLQLRSWLTLRREGIQPFLSLSSLFHLCVCRRHSHTR